MREIYLASYDGRLRLSLAERDSMDAGDFDALSNGDLSSFSPVYSGGDPDLLLTTVYRRESGKGGVVAVFSGDGEPLFFVWAASNLALVECTSHVSEIASNLRYGADIFEDKMQGDD